MVLSRDNGTLVYTQKAKKEKHHGQEAGFQGQKNETNKQGEKIPRCKSHKEPSNLTNMSHSTLLPLSHDALVIPRPNVL